MDRNIHNVDEIREEKELYEVNRLLKDGWIIITTRKMTFHDEDDWEEINYHLGHLIIE